jgi:hypothetical protein
MSAQPQAQVSAQVLTETSAHTQIGVQVQVCISTAVLIPQLRHPIVCRLLAPLSVPSGRCRSLNVFGPVSMEHALRSMPCVVSSKVSFSVFYWQ